MDCETISVRNERGMNLRTRSYRAKRYGEVLSLQEVSTTPEIETLTRKISRRTWHGMDSSFPRLRPRPYYEEKTEARPYSEQVRYAYFKSECFEHFHYISKLLQDCRSRVNKVRKSLDQETSLGNEVMVKINYVGQMNDSVPIQKALQEGNGEVSVNQKTWEASPLICFQNDLCFTEAIQLLKTNTACHKILVKSGDVGEDTYTPDESIVIVDQDHVREAITSCLEDPLHQLLEKWLKEINATDSNKDIVWVILELENIRKQMSFKESKATTSSPTFEYAKIVPPDVKDYLLGRDDVSAFGTWLNSQFKVFMKKGADAKRLENELTKMNTGFFEKFKLEIETRTFFEQRSMRQGGQILLNPPNPDGQYTAGTLGGFATKAEEPNRKFALTCNHIFPMIDLPAYADSSEQFEMIGKCVFTTRENHCDFAAIEIDDSVSKKCNVAFRREDKKETNAHVYEDCINNLALLHKIGAESDVTTGYILSEEFYTNDIINDDNREFVFLVRGVNGIFSQSGDSGSLVFSRPKGVMQDYVYIVGMVYACDPIVRYEEKGQEKDTHSQEADKSKGLVHVADDCGTFQNNRHGKDCSQGEVLYSRETDGSKDLDHGVNKRHRKDCLEREVLHSRETDGLDNEIKNGSQSAIENKSASSERINPLHISMCYRIPPALELFRTKQGISVKFKDDLPPSSSSIF